jgi:hypothetical protein
VAHGAAGGVRGFHTEFSCSCCGWRSQTTSGTCFTRQTDFADWLEAFGHQLFAGLRSQRTGKDNAGKQRTDTNDTESGTAVENWHAETLLNEPTEANLRAIIQAAQRRSKFGISPQTAKSLSGRDQQIDGLVMKIELIRVAVQAIADQEAYRRIIHAEL